MTCRVLLAALVCWAVWQSPAGNVYGAASRCRTIGETSTALPGRVDTVVATSADGSVVALVGQARSSIRFLPHDTLDVLPPAGRTGGLHTVALPPYLAAPGVAATDAGTRLYVLVDSLLLTLSGASGHVLARQDLALQAIGWPAAITVDRGGDVYLIGQPPQAMEAQVYAFAPTNRHGLRLRWRTPLGLTHAGAWIGIAGPKRVAVYLPDQHDAQGTVVLLATRNGSLQGSYQVPVPPTAVSASLQRLYLAGAGLVRALALRSGAPTAVVPGNGPLTVSNAGLVAYLHAGQVVVARGDTLRTLLTLPFPAGRVPLALTWLGSTLVAGTTQGITKLSVGACL
jgi:hypothetical protein